jgi:hypothetical protein
MAAAAAAAAELSLEWWEGVCQLSQTNPKQATEIIEGLTKSDQALDASTFYLQSAACSPVARFQAIRVFQYASLNHRWGALSPDQKGVLRQVVWTVLESAIKQGDMPSFALNKIIQVFTLLWKRGWLEYDAGTKSQLFQLLHSLLQEPSTAHIGCTLMRSVVEEFGSTSSIEICLPLEFHRATHKSFEEYGISECMLLSSQTLSAAFTQLTTASTPEAIIANVANVGASVKLFNEILSWHFGSIDVLAVLPSSSSARSKGDEDDDGSGVRRTMPLLKLPRAWSTALIQPQLLDSMFGTYESIRSLIVSSASSGMSADLVGRVADTLGEVRGVIISMASMAGNIFETADEKLAMGDYMISRLSAAIEASLSTTVDSYAVGELQARELEHFALVTVQMMSNYKLRLICQMPNFERIMMVLGGATFNVSKDLAALAEYQLHKAVGAAVSGEMQAVVTPLLLSSDGDAGLLDGWRGDVVSLFLDAWCMVLDDPLMLENALSVEGTAHDASGPSIAQHLKVGLRGIASQVFTQLFESVNRTTLCDSFTNPDDEEDEDNEHVYVRNMDDLLSGICTVGRTNFTAAAKYVSGSIRTCLEGGQSLLTSGQEASATFERDCLKVLETLRISMLFASHLCADNFSGASKDPHAKASSETPMIPSFILDACIYDPAESIAAILELATQMVMILQFQMQIAQAPNGVSHPMLSPLVLQHVVQFFTEYVKVYLDTNPALYADAMRSHAPHIFALHGKPTHIL